MSIEVTLASLDSEFQSAKEIANAFTDKCLYFIENECNLSFAREGAGPTALKLFDGKEMIWREVIHYAAESNYDIKLEDILEVAHAAYKYRR